jgi:outer membrane receptor protein involved in Fe transport
MPHSRQIDLGSAARVALLALLVSTCAREVSAQSRPAELAGSTIEDLMKILVTTASRGAEGIASAPARVQVVTAAQIERRGYRSILDVLKDLPDFKVDLGGEADYPAEVTVQGTRGTSRVVLLLDGIRVSSPTNEPLPMVANYPVHNARQVEIVYGPASALYGADAFSAVINIISKEVAEAPGLTVASSVGQYGLYDQTGSYGVRLGANVNLMLSGQFLYDHQPDLSRSYPADFNGLQGQQSGVFNTIYGPMTSSRAVSPAYDIPLSAHSVQARLQAGGLVLALFQSASRVPTVSAYTPDNAVYNAAAFDDNRLLVASGTYTHDIGRVTSTSMLMFSRHELDPQSGYWNVFSNFEKSFKYAYGSVARVEQQLSWKPTPALTITTGAAFEHFFSIPQGADLNAPIQSQDAPGTILDTNIPDDFVKLRYNNTGLFGQAQYAVTPKVTLTLGARGDYNTRFGGTFNPRLGLVARPTESTTLKVLYGTAFLAPSPYQEYAHYGSFYSTDGGKTYASSYWHLPNPDLKPQQKKTAEANVLQSMGPHFQLSGSVFYTRLTNLIQTAGPDQSYAGFYHGWPVDYIDFGVNQGRAVMYGGSLGVDYVRAFGPDRRVEARAAAVFVNGREWETDVSTTSLPAGAMSPVQFRFGADFDLGLWRMAPRLSLVGAQRLLATTMNSGSLERRTLDGYATVDANIRRNLFKGLDGFVTVENAFDRRYRTINVRAYTNPEELVGAPQNPRRVSVGFSLRIR